MLTKGQQKSGYGIQKKMTALMKADDEF